MKFTKTNNTEIQTYRAALYQKLSAPVDAMWEILYIASAQPYWIELEGQHIGYCCVDEKGSLLQIYLEAEQDYQMSSVIQSLIQGEIITSASLSSNEPIAFNACLALAKSKEVNTFCFQHIDKEEMREPSLEMSLVSNEDIPAVQAFFKTHIGFEDNFGYTQNLVNRKELYHFVNEEGQIVASGECRLSDSQMNIADVGVIVNKDFRKSGLGTQVLRHMAKRARQAGRRPTCSTTHDNVASKKAIERAGFYCSHIIFDLHF